MQLPGHDAAKDHENRIVRELKDGGYCQGNAALVIHDETGQTVHSIQFLSNFARTNPGPLMSA
jgi:hypothetical protein